MDHPLVEIAGLTKSYGPFRALDECTLEIRQGEVFGLLGPNGAGKTTLIRTLLGYLKPTSGTASIAGLDCLKQSVEVRQVVSYLPAEAALYARFRGTDVLRFFAELRPGGSYGRALALAEQLELNIATRVGYMSTGMRQKLAFAAVMSAEAPLYILDEPTANLDPTVRGTVLGLVKRAQGEGKTIIFSSHVLSEVEEVCDRVAILRKGRVAHLQVIEELRSRHRILATLSGPHVELPAELALQMQVVNQSGHELQMETDAPLAPLLGWLATLPLKDMRVEPVGLRSVYEGVHRPAA